MASELKNFSFVIDGELAGLAYPSTDGAMEELEGLGFRSLASLSEDAPDCGPYGLVHLHCPLPDFARIPPLSLQRVTTFLASAP